MSRSSSWRGSLLPPMCIPAETFTKKIKPEMQPTDHMAVVASLHNVGTIKHTVDK